MISNGVGQMIEGIDRLYKIGMNIPKISSEILSHLQEVYPSYYIVQNPIDMTDFGTSDDYNVGIKAYCFWYD